MIADYADYFGGILFLLEKTVTKDPNEIKGSMTLTVVSEGWQIPLTTLIEKLGLPKDVDPNVPIREYDTPYGVGGETVREAVNEILGQ